MTSSLVLDCSVTMTWCFADEATPFSKKVLRDLEAHQATAPSLWVLEVHNVLLMAERKKRISRAQSTRFLNGLDGLAIQIDDAVLSIGSTNAILELARDYDLTVYDATYLELALRKALPIATLDKALRTAAKKIGIDLYV